MSTRIGNRIGIPFGGISFDPSSIKVDGVKTLTQQVLTKQAPTIAGVITDERKNKGDARDIQLRQFRNLNGTTQYGSVADNTDLDITDNLSVVVWAKNDTTHTGTIFGKYGGTGLIEWRIATTVGNKLLIQFGNASGGLACNIESTDTYASTTVKTLGFSFTGGTFKLYIDGVLVSHTVSFGTIPTTIFNGTEPLSFGVVSTSSTPSSYYDGDMYETRIYDTVVLTEAEMLAIHENPTGHAPVGARNVAHYKLDNNVTEEIIDSSGNGNDGTWVNAPTKSTGGAVHSWANDVGYTLGTGSNGYASGVFIPRNEAIPTQDVTGATLEFTGEVPYNAKAEQSNCIDLNGTSQYVTLGAGLTIFNDSTNAFTLKAKVIPNSVSGVRRIIAQQLGSSPFRGISLYTNGTALRFDILNSVSSDQLTGGATGITMTVGTYYDIEVHYDGSKSTSGVTFTVNGVVTGTTTVQDTLTSTSVASGTNLVVGRDSSSNYFSGKIFGVDILDGLDTSLLGWNFAEGAGTVANDNSGNDRHGTLINAPTWSKQDNYHANLVDGCSKYMYFDGTNDQITTPSFGLSANQVFRTEAYVTFDSNKLGNSRVFGTPTFTAFTLYWGSTNQLRATLGGTALSPTSALTMDGLPHKVVYEYTGTNARILVDDVVVMTQAHTFSAITPEILYIGSNGSTTFTNGVMYNFTFEKDGVVDRSYNGYGNTNADWEDTSGNGNDGTVSGSPANIYIPAVSSTLDAFGETLKNPAGAYHNGAETLIDFTNNVLSPQAVINSWETAWAFNTARTNPEFKRTLTSGGADHRADRFLAYREALSGTNLTKVQNYTEEKAL